MSRFRKLPTEREILTDLRSRTLKFPPLEIRAITKPVLKPALDSGVDIFLRADWLGKRATFAVECKSSFSPRAVREAAAHVKAYTNRSKNNYHPMVVVPFLSEEKLHELQHEKVSGVDLCGNGVVIVPGLFAAYRTGGQNCFRTSAPIKNIYRKNSSIVGRVFLARPKYNSVADIQKEIESRTLSVLHCISLPTISKTLKGLEDELIVNRGPDISLIQPAKLLDMLSSNFIWERGRRSVRAKLRMSEDQLADTMANAAESLHLPLIATGLSSVTRYAVMQRGSVLSMYCPKPEELLDHVGADLHDRFPNAEVIEAAEPFLYFDARAGKKLNWASPVQTYLELMSGDKRDRETADQVRNAILREVQTHSP